MSKKGATRGQSGATRGQSGETPTPEPEPQAEEPDALRVLLAELGALEEVAEPSGTVNKEVR